MCRGINGLYARRYMLVCAVLLFSAGAAVSATTHVVQFGGTLGLAYSPASFTVVVGDTVEWVGDFSVHPLSSSSIPAGASSWVNTSGSQFSYVVTLPGSYGFYCMVHGSPDGTGMAGSFTATALTGIGSSGSSAPAVFSLEQNYPNPFNPATTIRYSLPQKEHVSLKVFDVAGNVVATLVSADQAEGYHQVEFNGSKFASGVYFYRLEAGALSATRKLLELR
jgi:plastocyanin